MIQIKSDGSANFDLGLEWEITEEDYPGRAWPKKAKLSINGLSVHCYALRTRDDNESNVQMAWQPDFQAEFEHYQDANGGALCTVPLKGLQGQWAIFIVPHGI